MLVFTERHLSTNRVGPVNNERTVSGHCHNKGRCRATALRWHNKGSCLVIFMILVLPLVNFGNEGLRQVSSF